MRVLFVVISLMLLLQPAASAQTQQWLGTWGAAPAWSDPNNAFSDQTIREIIRTSVGGSSIRLHFTNRFGSGALILGDVSLGLAKENSPVPVAGSLHQVTFSGSRSVEIPPGAVYYSDPIAMTVPPESALLVSIFLPGQTGAPTYHPEAREYTFVANGDQSGNTDGGGFSLMAWTWFYLDAVEVQNSQARGVVAAFGDSITDGAKSTVGGDNRWTDVLARRLIALPAGQQFGVVNEGISGNRLISGAGDSFGIDALARFDEDVLAQAGVRDVIVLLGINDIQFVNSNDDIARLENALRQIVLRAHAHGIRVIGGTLIPFGGFVRYSKEREDVREQLNTFIRDGGIFDSVVDFDAALRDPSDPQRMLPAYDSGDHLHPNDSGYAVMGNLVPISAL